MTLRRLTGIALIVGILEKAMEQHAAKSATKD